MVIDLEPLDALNNDSCHIEPDLRFLFRPARE
jgi:hypothetical protein